MGEQWWPRVRRRMEWVEYKAMLAFIATIKVLNDDDDALGLFMRTFSSWMGSICLEISKKLYN